MRSADDHRRSPGTQSETPAELRANRSFIIVLSFWLMDLTRSSLLWQALLERVALSATVRSATARPQNTGRRQRVDTRAGATGSAFVA
jgi:hypothetical protein